MQSSLLQLLGFRGGLCPFCAHQVCEFAYTFVPNGKILPSEFLVVPGSSRTVPASKSTCFQVRVRTSDSILQPVSMANLTGALRWSGRATSRTSPREIEDSLAKIGTLEDFSVVCHSCSPV